MKQVKPFDPNDSQFNCCCGCHVMTGSKIIALINTIMIASETISATFLIRESNSDYNWVGLLVCTIYTVCSIAVIGCLWIGLIRERELYLIAFMVYQVLSIIAYIIPVILLLTNGSYYLAPVEHYDSSSGNDPLLASIGMLLGLIALQCWFFAILKSAYEYIKLKRCQPISEVTAAQQTEQAYDTLTNEGPFPSRYEEQPERVSPA